MPYTCTAKVINIQRMMNPCSVCGSSGVLEKISSRVYFDFQLNIHASNYLIKYIAYQVAGSLLAGIILKKIVCTVVMTKTES